MDNNLKLLGMARKAGRLEVGEEPVGGSARARKARLILLAADAAANTVRRATHFGEGAKIPVLATPYTKAELGSVVSRTSCAMMAITDAGFAASFAGKLAAQTPEEYGTAAQTLEKQAEKVLQRQREKRQHEKNLERGKKRLWALPSKRAEGKAPASKATGSKPAAPKLAHPKPTGPKSAASKPAGPRSVAPKRPASPKVAAPTKAAPKGTRTPAGATAGRPRSKSKS